MMINLSKNCPRLFGVLIGLSLCVLTSFAWAAFSSEADAASGLAKATVRVGKPVPPAAPISPYLTGKFCAHFRNNIYNGMDAQILRNPTFGDFRFPADEAFTPDGVRMFKIDPDEIAERIRWYATYYLGWPSKAQDHLVESYQAGLAGMWTRVGTKKEITVSPDSDDYGNRAQRIETKVDNKGIAQWAYLPLRRVRSYEFELRARAPKTCSLIVAISHNNKICDTVKIPKVGPEWRTYKGVLRIPRNLPQDAPYCFGILANEPAHFLVTRVALRPTDHVHGFDPEIVRLWKEARLPILRGPGGNFVSGYHWEDGIGPIDTRPTRHNFASGQWVEPNLFGTDELIAFCREVGCEPLICINAGNGTPEEAARWVEYCNGPADSPMGRLRAANGHPEPYGVHHWEIGNELYGYWQIHHTTPAGNADRYLRFAEAMRAVDPTIELYACGSQMITRRDRDWNKELIQNAGSKLSSYATHLLIGSNISRDSDPLDVFRNYMFMPDVFAPEWKKVADAMQKAGVAEPKIAITELQIFAQLAKTTSKAKTRLNDKNLIRSKSMAEAMYDTIVYHHAVRMTPRLSVITHSSTANHAGGLWTWRGKIYAHPCYYLQSKFADFAKTMPLPVEVQSPEEQAPIVVPGMKPVVTACKYKALDAVAAQAEDGTLLLSLVHRGTQGPLQVDVDLSDFRSAVKAEVGKAEIWTLTADHPWEVNWSKDPEHIVPKTEWKAVQQPTFSLEINPYSIVQIRLPAAK